MTYKQKRTVTAFVEAVYGKDATYTITTIPRNKKAMYGDADNEIRCQLRVEKAGYTVAESDVTPSITAYDHDTLGTLLGTIKGI